VRGPARGLHGGRRRRGRGPAGGERFPRGGNHVTALCGARSDALRILDAELQTSVDELKWATDDGTFGFHGNVLQLLQSFAKPGDFDIGHVIGPIPMMKAVANATRDWGMKLYASLNPS